MTLQKALNKYYLHYSTLTYLPVDKSNEQHYTEFSEELSALINCIKENELRMVASQHAIDRNRTAAAAGDK
jgi:hypothetical protein